MFTSDQIRRYFECRLPHERIQRRDFVTVRCAFHQDRNPSLSINLKSGVFNCHGCQAQGGILDFERRMMASDAETAWREIYRIIGAEPKKTNGRKLVKMYDYVDVRGQLLYQKLRYEPKSFSQRRPNGKGGWVYNLDGVRKVLYNLPKVMTAMMVVICEGEKDADNLAVILPDGWATTTMFDGAGRWRDDYAPYFTGKFVIVAEDNDEPGRKHAQMVAASVAKFAERVKIFRNPENAGKDISDWIDAASGDSQKQFLAQVEETATWCANPTNSESTGSAWTGESMFQFLNCRKQEVHWLFPGVLAKGCLTQMFAPRGLGKSVLAHCLAVQLAKTGKRVLLLDRDNPRSVLQERLRNLDAEQVETLRIISREKCPSLTRPEEWANFPYGEYDLVIVDALDSMAEGIGEQDSAKPARAMGPLLDICHHADGPAVLLLGNTIKSGEHSRGSGVIEDRADIVFELRDGTDFTPTGSVPWIDELPAQGAKEWKTRSARRKGKSVFRLAMVATKFRLGEEPAPRMLEIDMASSPWTLRDVTTEVDAAGESERLRKVTEKESRIQAGTQRMLAELARRRVAGEPPILKKEGEAFLMVAGHKQADARQILNSDSFRTLKGNGPGHPLEVHSADLESTTEIGLQEPVNDNAASTQSEFGHPHQDCATTISAGESPVNTGDLAPPDSVGSSLLAHGQTEKEGEWLVL